MSVRLPALLATGAVTLAAAAGLGMSTAPLAHAASQVFAYDDFGFTTPGTPVTLDLLANDHCYGSPLDRASVRFDPTQGDPSQVVADNGLSMTVAGQGELALNGDGTVTFSPAQGFHRDVYSAHYLVRCQDGTVGDAYVSLSVRSVSVGRDDSVTLAATDQKKSLDVFANDEHDSNSYIANSTLSFADGQPDVVVDGTGLTASTSSGTYTIDNQAHRIGFVPVASFSGIAVPIAYTAIEFNGRTFSAYVRPTVLAVPTWAISPASAVALKPRAIDAMTAQLTYSDGRAGDPTQVRFASPQVRNPGSTVGDSGRSLTLAGGTATATIDATTGVVTVTGARATEGKLTFDLRTTRDYAQDATAALEVTMAHGMLANDDSARTSYMKPVTVPVVANDVAGTASSIDAGSVRFAETGQPTGATVFDDGRSLLVPGEGGYSVDPSGTITFTAQNGSTTPAFVGTTSSVTYQVADGNGNTGTATLTIAVHAPLRAVDDTLNTPFFTYNSVNVLANDGDSSLIDAKTIRFTADDAKLGTIGADGHSLTIAGQGTFSLYPGNPNISFLPYRDDDDYFKSYQGPVTPVTYAVDSTDGTTLAATLTVVVGPHPIANPDAVTIRSGHPVTVDVSANDVVDPRAHLVEGGNLAYDQPMAGAAFDDSYNLVIPSVGTFSMNGFAVTFMPVPGYVGTAFANYQIYDSFDNSGIGTVSVHVLKPMTSVDDAVAVPNGNSTSIPVLTNDSTDSSLSIAASSLRFADDQADATLSSDKRTVTTKQGTYRVVGSSVTFTPATGFTGKATPVTYQVDDSGGGTDTATVTVTVHKAVVANDDTAGAQLGMPVSVPVLSNDSADPAVPLRVASVTFAGVTQPAGSTVGNGGRYVVVPNQGTYLIDTDGTITFVPYWTFAGVATPVRYSVADGDGTRASASIRVSVVGQITARADAPSVAWGVATGVNVLGNDSTMTAFVPGSVLFNATGQPAGSTLAAGNRQLSVPGQATYVINASTGVMTVTPLKSVSGRVLSPVRYSVKDTSGASSSAGVVTVSVRAVPGLAGVADVVTTKVGKAVTSTVIGNDHASPGSKFVASSVLLTGATSKAVRTALTNGGKKLVVAGQGTYAVNASGSITFTPVAAYVGKATPVAYRATDGNGFTVSSTLTVTVAR